MSQGHSPVNWCNSQIINLHIITQFRIKNSDEKITILSKNLDIKTAKIIYKFLIVQVIHIPLGKN